MTATGSTTDTATGTDCVTGTRPANSELSTGYTQKTASYTHTIRCGFFVHLDMLKNGLKGTKRVYNLEQGGQDYGKKKRQRR